MLDSKFSIEEFKKIKVNSDLSSELHKELQDQIAKLLHAKISDAFTDISNQLIKLGHSLEETKPEYDDELSSWVYEFLDSSNKDNPRICLDTQVCVLSGYTADE